MWRCTVDNGSCQLILLSCWTKTPLTFDFCLQWERVQSATIPRSEVSHRCLSDPGLISCVLKFGCWRVNIFPPISVKAGLEHRSVCAEFERDWSKRCKRVTIVTSTKASMWLSTAPCSLVHLWYVRHTPEENQKGKLLSWQGERSQLLKTCICAVLLL